MSKELFTIGVVGHRYLGGEKENLFVQFLCYKILALLRVKYPEIRAISAMSPGADTIFAQSAILHSIQLELVIPFDDFRKDYKSEGCVEKYDFLRKKACCENVLNFGKRDNYAYKKSMELVVIKSDIIVAVWDGKMVSSECGTCYTMVFCEKLNKTVLVINVKDKKLQVRAKVNKRYRSFDNIEADYILKIL